jgi:hypothetical protein
MSKGEKESKSGSHKGSSNGSSSSKKKSIINNDDNNETIVLSSIDTTASRRGAFTLRAAKHAASKAVKTVSAASTKNTESEIPDDPFAFTG